MESSISYNSSYQETSLDMGRNDEYNNFSIPTQGKVFKTIPLGIFAISILLPLPAEASPQQEVSFSFTNSYKSKGITKIITHEKKNAVNFLKMSYCMQIQDLGTLKEDWDGYGAIRVLPICISNAQNIINYKNILCEQIQDIYANSNGTISILWENANNESIGLEIGEKTMSYYAVKKDRNTFIKNVPFTEQHYIELSSHITQL